MGSGRSLSSEPCLRSRIIVIFQLKLEDGTTWEDFGHQPGQFVEVSAFGKGEAPISISSPPTRPDTLELCVRRAGTVTNALFEMGKGSAFHIRGPYGRGFPLEQLKGRKLLLIAGGLGLAPLRSLLLYALDKRDDFDNIILMYGTNNPDNVLFKYELVSFFDRNDIQYYYSVDRDDEGIWKQYVGVVTGLFDRTSLTPEDTYAVICGPPIMYRFVLQKLLSPGFTGEHIYYVPGEDAEVRRQGSASLICLAVNDAGSDPRVPQNRMCIPPPLIPPDGFRFTIWNSLQGFKKRLSAEVRIVHLLAAGAIRRKRLPPIWLPAG